VGRVLAWLRGCLPRLVLTAGTLPIFSRGSKERVHLSVESVVVYALGKAKEGLTLLRLQLILFLADFELARKGLPRLGVDWKLSCGLPVSDELRRLTEDLAASGILIRSGEDAMTFLASPAFRGRNLMLPKKVRGVLDKMVSSYGDPTRASKLLHKIQRVIPAAIELGIVSPPTIRG